ncbi:MAG: ABC transporter ATP-binding protein [Candidatus Symbiobacter sp.]|nr:ABC transporter ATP-binding protein [Candidatus Symbiobacter sp.]
MRLENVTLRLDQALVLDGVSLHVDEGEMVTLLGRNGMGKTSLVQAIMGIRRVQPSQDGQSQIWFAEQEITRLPTHVIAKLGIGLVPEQRQIFPNLTVRENLQVAARVVGAARPGRENAPSEAASLPIWDLARVEEIFPILRDRARQSAASLSGGEQQMLAIARALMTNPRLLILDEVCEGIAPIIRQQIWQCLTALRQMGMALLVIDKNIADLLDRADRHYILQKGQVVWQGNSQELRSHPEMLEWGVAGG